MTKSEMRMIRREFISDTLRFAKETRASLSTIKLFVRLGEKANFGFELQAYQLFSDSEA